MTENDTEGMAKVLVEHAYSLGPDGRTCECNWKRPYPAVDESPLQVVHTRHVADALAAAGYGDVREVEEALECCREQRTDLRELVDVERERAEKAEAERDKAWSILGDLGFCTWCKDGSTMPCTECGAGL